MQDRLYGTSDFVLSRFDKGVPKSWLVNLFMSKEAYERTNWILPMKRGILRRPVGLGLFLYQAMMDTLGASPKYFTPSAASSRALAFAYAFCKFLFFGIVITTFGKQLALRIEAKSAQNSNLT
jgi:hypothetical protein